MAPFPLPASSVRTLLRCAATLCAGLTVMVHSPAARADDAGDVATLMRAGRLADAQALAENRLAQQPKDARLRLLRGMILAQQNKPVEAISAFRKMTEDFPDLPEPYNNLGVLLANAGEVDKARAAFELAIHLRPSYVAAQENLGDLHARLARRAYDKAAELDPTNAGVHVKSASLRSIVGGRPVAPNAAEKALAPVVAAADRGSAPVKR